MGVFVERPFLQNTHFKSFSILRQTHVHSLTAVLSHVIAYLLISTSFHFAYGSSHCSQSYRRLIIMRTQTWAPAFEPNPPRVRRCFWRLIFIYFLNGHQTETTILAGPHAHPRFVFAPGAWCGRVGPVPWRVWCQVPSRCSLASLVGITRTSERSSRNAGFRRG